MTRWYPQNIMLELKEGEEWPQRQGKLLRQVALIIQYLIIILIVYL